MKLFRITLALISLVLLTASCDDSKSYAELLSDERKATNAYLATQKVINEIPADTVFEEGENAPFYRIDEEGNVYMQVISSGDRKNNRAKEDEEIYFRWMRISLLAWATGSEIYAEGNAEDMGYNSYFFRYNNFTLASSSQYGSGIQMPLDYLGVDCTVRLIIKSQYGFSSEIANVVPYLYTVRYFRSKI